jgi:hypothetical protein
LALSQIGKIVSNPLALWKMLCQDVDYQQITCCVNNIAKNVEENVDMDAAF